jgi:hypothetical protein
MTPRRTDGTLESEAETMATVCQDVGPSATLLRSIASGAYVMSVALGA